MARGGTLRNLRGDDTLGSRHFALSGHPVTLAEGSLLARILQRRTLDTVMSFHGQAVDEPGTGVRIAARSPDGVVEAVEIAGDGDSPWIIGVQWHPELAVGDKDQERLLCAFIARAAAVRDGARPLPAHPAATAGPGTMEAQGSPLEGQVRRWAVKVEMPGLPNFHRVSENLYRGAQPTAEGMKELARLGVKTVVNLRWAHSDRDEIGDLKLDYVHIPMQAWHAEDEKILMALSVLTDETRWPVFVHCEHGADRTGIVCAAYRITVCGWSKSEAIKEMTEGGFGFHSIWSNLVAHAENLDTEALKAEAGLSHRTEGSCD